ncbi:hypothetical protein [Kangiella koreensis]|uniref:Uncharacterized protein n=1 Tax=Kangiella koreensis (strain DSM 16069 / JCM 12317 / KCTC 12182 / SW-125) TaxID=523791 RepID=C7RC00_KANKD|nr:hypothetical protein [Kangiella koreensis]ACV26792.1 hypothetical protein Kkor_1379 [Kangiella koreensis DSM 16069]
MNTDFLLSINDQNRWKKTDTESQQRLVERLISEVSKIEAGEVKKVRSGFVPNNAGADFANALLSGLSIPALLTSAGYLLKHLSPLLIEYMRSRSAKEITVDIHGKRITIKGGGDFEDELNKVIQQAETLDNGSNNDA